MKERLQKLGTWWTKRGALALSILFTITFTILMFRKHDALNTRTYDLARFDQAIWNTLHGRLLFSSIRDMSILGNHFSPLMALLSPLFVIWNDVKVLFLVQTVSIAATGICLYKIVRLKHPSLAPCFLLAFYLNPAVHEVTLFEFRRIVLAMPFLAWALYALYTKKRWLMVVGLGLALLCKEDVALVVIMIGLYLIVFERDWKWGLPMVVVGSAWILITIFWIIPSLSPGNNYPQTRYFDFLGDSLPEMVQTLLRDPLILFRAMSGTERWLALGRILLPMGLVLPFLAPEWAAICLPVLAYMWASDNPVMFQLKQWYAAPMLPILFAAIGVGMGRLSDRRAKWATSALLATTFVGYVLFSPAPLGGTYEASLYKVTEHHRLAAEIIDAIPPETSVATQPHYVPHLSHREHIYHYPWIVIGEENVDYVLLDRHSDPYPFSKDELDAKITDMVTDPAYEIQMEADGIYLFRKAERPLLVDRVVDDSMKLAFAQITVQDENGLFSQPSHSPIQVQPGQQIRVALFWEALDAPEAERTVSVRLASAEGELLAQQDNWPGQGTKPTSWWETGWQIRDVHYLTAPPDTLDGSATLSVLVYDSHSLEVISLDDGAESVEIASVEIVP